MICGNTDAGKETLFPYRSSSYITRFFQECDTDYVHDGSTRNAWVGSTLVKILEEPQTSGNAPPDTFSRVIRTLMDQADKQDVDPSREKAIALLNVALAREGYEAFYAEDRQCYLKHIATNMVARSISNPHRPFSATELKRRGDLSAYLERCSEDELIGEVLLPLLRQLRSNKNIAEMHQQVLMMLGHEIFDSETSNRVLVDHAFIVAGGEITKAARNWLGEKLDATKRSQIMFMDREDILNLYVVTNLPLPDAALPEPIRITDDDIPF